MPIFEGYIKQPTMKKIFTLLAVMLTLSLGAFAQGLVINEVDYDQPSLDSAEANQRQEASATGICTVP